MGIEGNDAWFRDENIMNFMWSTVFQKAIRNGSIAVRADALKRSLAKIATMYLDLSGTLEQRGR